MKKIVAAWLLAIASIAIAQTPTTTPQTVDPAEYKAYQAAIGTTDAAQRGAALEQFVLMYPKSTLKEPVLVEAMVAYQQAGNNAKVQSVAAQILEINPSNLRALALLTFIKAQSGEAAMATPQGVATLGEAAQYAQKGLQVLQSSTDPDTQKMKPSLLPIFNEAIGASALANKNYPDAQKYLHTAVEGYGSNATLNHVYLLSTAYLSATPIDCINGCWFAARAVDMAPPAQQQQLNQFGLYYYKKYHGGDQGWQDILNLAKTTLLPPAGFNITPAPPPPTPAQQAQDVLSKYKVNELGLSDWLFILGSGFQQGADQVWDTVKGKQMQIQGTVLSATNDSVILMIT